MKIKSIVFGLSIISALGSGFLYFAPEKVDGAVMQSTPQVQATQNAEPTTPTIQPTPTVDAFAVYQAQASQSATLNEQAAQDNLEAARLLAESQRILAESNIRAAQIYAAQKQADNEAAIEIANYNAQQAQAETDAIREQANLKAEENKADAIKQQAVYDWAILIISIVMSVVVLFGIVIFIRGWVRPVEQQSNEQDEEEAEQPLTGYIGGVDIRPFGQFSFDALKKIAKGVTDGKDFTYEVWTPDTMSKETFGRLQHLMVSKGLAQWKGARNQVGVTLTPKGKKFFRELAYPPAPPPKPAYFLPIPDRQDTTDTEFTPMGDRSNNNS
jgi:hypothetical protein